ncbi:CobW family GTP-binding protein [Pseudomonas putida]|uniref:CobW family GTP-binding protein n=1 Tax=Pseudomonas putida TaxID=303 RepID=UPI0018D5CB37|nr:CobW-like GTP-binding protein [Pseudomonas putida]MBH3460867.1 cobalamin biosynthesis protein CobW [Pseudomonas putida]
MLQHIPTYVIAGPLGAGKTSLIRHLLGQRPENERWAVLVNEFGQIGLDAALLSTDASGVAIGEVAGGCLCCVNGAPFQVGLGRLLRKAKPDRLFIEPSGLGHPVQLLEQLRRAPWIGVLDVQPLLMVLDAVALARGEPLPDAQQQAVAQAGLLIFNKSEDVDDAQRLLITAAFGEIRAVWTDHAALALDNLPILSTEPLPPADLSCLPVDSAPVSLAALWTDPRQPICQEQQGEGGWSVGWRWHPSQRFDEAALRGVLAQWAWRRAKGVIHSTQGWQSFNGLGRGVPEWRSSEWRRDSRIELIFDQPQPLQPLQAAIEHCRVNG